MTQKELLYLEDAYSHENIIINICNDIIEALESEDLVSFMEREVKKHCSYMEKLGNFLEEKSDE